MTTTTRFQVQGMTCDHCVRAVEAEVAEVPGVVGARAELDGGVLTITADARVSAEAVAAAVREAGYEVAT